MWDFHANSMSELHSPMARDMIARHWMGTEAARTLRGARKDRRELLHRTWRSWDAFASAQYPQVSDAAYWYGDYVWGTVTKK